MKKAVMQDLVVFYSTLEISLNRAELNEGFLWPALKNLGIMAFFLLLLLLLSNLNGMCKPIFDLEETSNLDIPLSISPMFRYQFILVVILDSKHVERNQTLPLDIG